MSKKLLLRSVPLAVGATLVSLAMGTGTALATPLEEGHPEAIVNVTIKPTEAEPKAYVSWGSVTLTSPQVENSEIECVNIVWGALWNAGSPKRGVGAVIGWWASGHYPNSAHAFNPKLSEERAKKCRFHSTTITEATELEVFASSEEKKESTGVVKPISTPWDIVAHCGEREEEKVVIENIGTPATKFKEITEGKVNPYPHCATEAEETAEVEHEIKEKQNCYASEPAPAGCVNVNIEIPAVGFQEPYSGTVRLVGENGFSNGLNPSHNHFEGNKPIAGYLVHEGKPGTTEGRLPLVGFEGVELIQAK